MVEIASKSSNREDFLTFGKIIDALEGGAKGSITVAVACGVAGIISGCITVTGLASKLLSTIVSLSGGHMIIALALTMLCCIVLGMGVPTTANYCIMAATCAPILMDPSIGVTKMAAPLLRVLLRHCGGHHAAGGPGGLCRQRHCQGGSHEDRVQRHETGHSGLYRAIHLRFQPQMLFVDVTGAFQVVQICISAPAGHLRRGGGLNGFLYRPIPALLRWPGRGRPGYDDPRHGHRHRRLCVVGGIVLYQRFSARRAAMV